MPPKETLSYNGDIIETAVMKDEEAERQERIDLIKLHKTEQDYLYDLMKQNTPTRQQIRREQLVDSSYQPLQEYVGDIEGFGTSRFDKRITRPSQLEDLENTRAYLQSGFGKIAASVPKMATLAATSYLDATVGTIVGLVNLGGEMLQGNINSWRDAGDAFLNNPVSDMLLKLNEASERTFKNHYTNEERERPWWRNMGTANFWGDTILKNMGFTIGAGLSGATVAKSAAKVIGKEARRDLFKGLSAELADQVKGKPASQILRELESGKITIGEKEVRDALKKRAKDVLKSDMLLASVGAVSAAIGEGRIEGLNAAKEYEESFGDLDSMRLEALNDVETRMYKENPSAYREEITPYGGHRMVCIDPAYQAAIDREKSAVEQRYASLKATIDDNKNMVANTVFSLNVPLLTFGNIVQFGKFMAGSYETGRSIAKGFTRATQPAAAAIENAPAKTSATTSLRELAATQLAKDSAAKRIATGAGKALKNSLTEGQEEMSQSWASSLSKYKAMSNVMGEHMNADVGEFVERLYDPSAQVEGVSWLNAIHEGFKQSWGNPDTYVEGFAGLFMGAFGLPGIEVLTDNEGNAIAGKNGQPKKGVVMRGGVWDAFREGAVQKERAKAVDMLNKRLASEDFIKSYYGFLGHISTEQGKTAAIANGNKAEYDRQDHMQLINDLVMADDAGMLQDFVDTIDALASRNFTDEELDDIKQTLNDDKLKGMDNDTLRKQLKDNADTMKRRVDDYKKVSTDLKVLYGDSRSTQQMQEIVWNTVRRDDLNAQIDEKLKSLGTYIDAYKHKESANNDGKEAKEDKRTNLDIATSLGFLTYMSETAKTSPSNSIDNAVQDTTDLVVLDQQRKKYIRNIARLSQDPELVEKHMKRIDDERTQDMQQHFVESAMSSIEQIDTFGKLMALRDDNGKLNALASDLLHDQKSKGNKRAEALLEMYHMGAGVISSIRERIAASGLDEATANTVIQAAVNAFIEHAQSASSVNEMLQPMTNAEAQRLMNITGDNLAVDVINTMMSEALSLYDAQTSQRGPTVAQDTAENHKRSLIEVTRDDAPLFVKNKGGNPTRLVSGMQYVFDTTDPNNVIAYTADGSREVGKVYRDDSGSESSALTAADLMGNTNGFTVRAATQRMTGAQMAPATPPKAKQAPNAKTKRTAKKTTSNPFAPYKKGDTLQVDGGHGATGVVENVTSTRITLNFGKDTNGNDVIKSYSADEAARLKKVDFSSYDPVQQQPTEQEESRQVDEQIEGDLKKLRNRIRRKANEQLRKDAKNLGEDFINALNKALDKSLVSNDRYDAMSELLAIAGVSPDNTAAKEILAIFNVETDTSETQEQETQGQTGSVPQATDDDDIYASDEGDELSGGQAAPSERVSGNPTIDDHINKCRFGK